MNNIVTDDILIERAREHFEAAKLALATTKEPSAGDITDLAARAAVILQNGLETKANLPWTNSREKYAWGKAASEAAKLMGAQALIVTTVVTQLHEKNVLPELGLKSTSEVSEEEFLRRMWKFVEFKTGGSRVLGKLPRRYRLDALMSVGIGPRVAGAMVMQHFTWCDGAVVFGDGPEVFDARIHGHFNFNVVPKWWV
jgi:hypothetical protein